MLEELQIFLAREPFVTLRVILSSGTVYNVTSPYQLYIEGLRGRYYFERTDRRAVFSVIEVVAIETLEDDEHR